MRDSDQDDNVELHGYMEGSCGGIATRVSLHNSKVFVNLDELQRDSRFGELITLLRILDDIGLVRADNFIDLVTGERWIELAAMAYVLPSSSHSLLRQRIADIHDAATAAYRSEEGFKQCPTNNRPN